MRTFKVGDQVYCPMIGTEVYTLLESGNSARPLRLPAGNDVGSILVGTDGTVYSREAVPSIFHADKKNYKLLCKLYGKAFDDPVMLTLDEGLVGYARRWTELLD